MITVPKTGLYTFVKLPTETESIMKSSKERRFVTGIPKPLRNCVQKRRFPVGTKPTKTTRSAVTAGVKNEYGLFPLVAAPNTALPAPSVVRGAAQQYRFIVARDHSTA